jgi:hypothetical protein
MTKQTMMFKYEHDNQLDQVRTVEIDGEIWFVASDVAKVLGYSNPRDAISRHCKEKGVVKHDIPTKSNVQSMTLINEPNIYRLISRSKIPSAEASNARKNVTNVIHSKFVSPRSMRLTSVRSKPCRLANFSWLRPVALLSCFIRSPIFLRVSFCSSNRLPLPIDFF